MESEKKKVRNATCSSCNRDFPITSLYVKRAVFSPLGKSATTVLRSRSVAYLCRSCLRSDPDYQLPARALRDKEGL
jgi:ribosomal protein L34E